jgi:ATP-dependent exoDNAse (exonuclease V) alpha subunit
MYISKQNYATVHSCQGLEFSHVIYYIDKNSLFIDKKLNVLMGKMQEI